MRRKLEKHFLELNPHYHLIYYQLLKEEKQWNTIGQYWLGKEAERRAKCLLNGNIKDYETVNPSDKLYYTKKTF